jgi:hypothetical protein
MATTEETLALVEGLARIARTYKLDGLSVGEVRLVRSQHDFELPKPQKPGEEIDPDDLFHSAGS